MRSRRLTTLLVSTSLLVVVAGCGSAADGPVVGAAVAPATDAPVPAVASGGAAMLLRAVTGVGSRSVAVEMTVDGGVVATGALDPASRRARVTVDLGRLTGPSGSSARSLPAGLAPTGTVDAVVDGATAYLRPGSLGPVLGVPADRPWIRVASDALGLPALDRAGSADMLDLGGLDLPSVLASLGRIAGAMRDEGPDTVRGVATTRYSLAVPAGDDRSVPVLVWLDAEALPRRIELRAPDGRNVRIEAFDWGRPVEVTVPTPATIVELRDLPLLGALVDRLVAARSARGSGSD
jgi:hypothetical protein